LRVKSDYLKAVELLQDSASEGLSNRPADVKRRKKVKQIKAYPAYVTDNLANYVESNLSHVRALGHEEVEIIWDDGCCAAIFCADCSRWGHFSYDYQTGGKVWDDGGPEYSGEIFGARCGAVYEHSVASAVSANITGRRIDDWKPTE
jgi:hypothetical protein